MITIDTTPMLGLGIDPYAEADRRMGRAAETRQPILVDGVGFRPRWYSQPGDYYWECDRCGKEFATLRAIINHVKVENA